MILHDAEADAAFEARIDGRFPYEDPVASSLIREGWMISLNAAFCVLHELCRPPDSAVVSCQRLRELISRWAAGPDHPLKAAMLMAADRLLGGRALPWREGVALMRRVGGYDGQRAALAIAYFVSDSDTPEGDQALEVAHAEICATWAAKGV